MARPPENVFLLKTFLPFPVPHFPLLQGYSVLGETKMWCSRLSPISLPFPLLSVALRIQTTIRRLFPIALSPQFSFVSLSFHGWKDLILGGGLFGGVRLLLFDSPTCVSPHSFFFPWSNARGFFFLRTHSFLDCDRCGLSFFRIAFSPFCPSFRFNPPSF